MNKCSMACIDRDYEERSGLQFWRNVNKENNTCITKFIFRIGNFYPLLDSNFSYDACPVFWKDKKIKINLLNFQNASYISDIEVTAFIGIGIDVVASVIIFCLVWRYSNMRVVYNNNNGGFGPWSIFGRTVGPFFSHFGKTRFILKIIFTFGSPLMDSILG